jgi:hypothetical protein
MLTRRQRAAISWAMCYGPAAAWLVYAMLSYGPTRGYLRVLAIALFVGVAVLGLTAVFIAYFPATIERLGGKRFAAWLRTWWDEDAK